MHKKGAMGMNEAMINSFLQVLSDLNGSVVGMDSRFTITPDGIIKPKPKPKPDKKEPDKKKATEEPKFSHYEVVIDYLNDGTEVVQAYEYDVDDDYIVVIPVKGQMKENKELDEVVFPRENVLKFKVYKVYV